MIIHNIYMYFLIYIFLINIFYINISNSPTEETNNVHIHLNSLHIYCPFEMKSFCEFLTNIKIQSEERRTVLFAFGLVRVLAKLSQPYNRKN